jgi:tRNA (adenine57-N1/adenine58-N1)-methyltransferase
MNGGVEPTAPESVVAGAAPDDLVVLISEDRKRFFVRLQPGHVLHTHKGQVYHDDILGQPLGRWVTSHIAHRFLVLPPSVHDLSMNVKRATQIVYPKDIGYILVKMNIVPGVRVVEAGSGSGALTLALARYVWPGGRVYSYEVREDMLDLASKNVALAGLDEAVDFKLRHIDAGFDEKNVDAVFLDVREPWHYLGRAAEALRGGGFFGALVPTANQVIDLLAELRVNDWADIEVSELLLRLYKPVPGRLRPEDRLTPHTGYLIFARYVVGEVGSGG